MELCIHVLNHVGLHTHYYVCWMQTLLLIKKSSTGNFEQLLCNSEYIRMVIHCNRLNETSIIMNEETSSRWYTVRKFSSINYCNIVVKLKKI